MFLKTVSYTGKMRGLPGLLAALILPISSFDHMLLLVIIDYYITGYPYAILSPRSIPNPIITPIITRQFTVIPLPNVLY